MSHFWLEGALAILKRFKEDGAPRADLADWSGRWWSARGPTDLVPVGDKVVLSAPGLTNPVAKAGELTITGPGEARISQAGAFANYGEPARLIRDAAGAIASVQLAGGSLVSEAELAAELTARYEH
jgi:D-alanyl-D-alanine carboxypeptidase